jgi:hypothetical protein
VKLDVPRGQSTRVLVHVRAVNARIWGVGELELGERAVVGESSVRVREVGALMGREMQRVSETQRGLEMQIDLVKSLELGRVP